MILKQITLPSLKLVLISLFFTFPFVGVIAGTHSPKLVDTVTFRVDMSYMVATGKFHPALDSLDIIGTMNNWQGSQLMQRVDTSFIYELSLSLTTGVIYQYKYRIDRDSMNIEAIPPDSLQNRFFRCPDTIMTVTNYYNDYNPSKIRMTFNCDLYYQVRAGHFTTTVDYLDVAGNFNNNGAYDVLFTDAKDSLYSVTLLLDTIWTQGIPLKFKFRFNGNWTTSELMNDSSRVYTLNFPSGSYTCWYNNIDPNVPAVPFAYNLSIQDSLWAHKIVTGIYTYEDYNLKPEGKSRYQWYRADSIGGVLTAIDTANKIAYTLDSINDIGKYVVFEVTPVTNDSIVGLPVHVFSKTKIFGVGIENHTRLEANIYPNPCHDVLTIDPSSTIRMVEIYNPEGTLIKFIQNSLNNRFTVSTGDLPSGFYLIRLTGSNNLQGMFRIVVLH